jgi:hypothetical protein
METADNKEAELTEYICDMPDCPNPAEHVLGFSRELGGFAAVCAPHRRMLGEENKR